MSFVGRKKGKGTEDGHVSVLQQQKQSLNLIGDESKTAMDQIMVNKASFQSIIDYHCKQEF